MYRRDRNDSLGSFVLMKCNQLKSDNHLIYYLFSLPLVIPSLSLWQLARWLIIELDADI
jgi:hypothetical protein